MLLGASKTTLVLFSEYVSKQDPIKPIDRSDFGNQGQARKYLLGYKKDNQSHRILVAGEVQIIGHTMQP